MAMPSYAEHPEAYGMPGLRPAYFRAHGKNLVPRSDKAVLMPQYDSTLIKPLDPVKGLEFKPADISGQTRPELVEVEPRRLLVDHNYQRELTNSSYALLIYILENWDWTKYQIPNVIRAPSGRMFITDGQTTALAALHHPQIKTIPVAVARVSEKEFVKCSAAAFLSLNMVKAPVPRADKLTAQLTMGDPLAAKIAEVFRNHRIRVIRMERAERQYAARETMVIGEFQNVLKAHGEEFFERLCLILANANFSPIRKIHVGAIRDMLRHENPKAPYDLDRLRNAMLSKIDKYMLNDALIDSRRKSMTQPKALAALYRRAYEKGAQPL